MSDPCPHHDHGEAILADNIGIAAVPPGSWLSPGDPATPYGGRPGLLFKFLLDGRSYQPVLFVGHELRRLPATLAAALADLPTEDGPVRCPGCLSPLHGPVAGRGACFACFPLVLSLADAAERVAAGAEVAPNRGRLAVPGFVDAYATTAVTTGVPMVATAIPTRVTPAEARRTAVHLLRAADEAELAE